MKIIYSVIFLILFILSGCNVETKECTKEGKVCEEGTVLSRGGLDCEFPECPKSTPLQEIVEGVVIPKLESEPNLEPILEPTPIIKEFDIIAKTWDFEPDIIKVNEGDTVILHIFSVDVTHGFRLIEFGINENLKPEETVDIEFVADQKGEFTYYCSIYCGSGHSNMNGKLIVE